MKVIAKTKDGDIVEVRLQRMFSKKCKVKECNLKHYGLGYCRNHHNMYKRNGDPLLKKKKGKRKNRKCGICPEPHFVFGCCKLHYRKNLRIKIIKHLGGECIICGERDMDVLERDHPENDGYKNRSKNGYKKWESVEQIFKGIKNKTLEKSFQILCRNCNWKKHLYNMEFNRLEKYNLVGF